MMALITPRRINTTFKSYPQISDNEVVIITFLKIIRKGCQLSFSTNRTYQATLGGASAGWKARARKRATSRGGGRGRGGGEKLADRARENRRARDTRGARGRTHKPSNAARK